MSNTNTNATSTAPLYVRFAQALRNEIRRLGLPEPTAADTETGFPQNEGYFFVEWGAHGQAPALIVPKSKTAMGNLHSHVDLSAFAGCITLPKKNGRVVCHFEPDVTKVSKALARFVGASKVDRRAPVRRLSGNSGTFVGDPLAAASQETQRSADPDASLSEPATPTTRLAIAQVAIDESYSEEEAERALAVLGHQA